VRSDFVEAVVEDDVPVCMEELPPGSRRAGRYDGGSVGRGQERAIAEIVDFHVRLLPTRYVSISTVLYMPEFARWHTLRDQTV
jgi:hypothetical protein